MVINDHVIVKVGESFVVIGLAVHQDNLRKAGTVHLMQAYKGNLEKPDHCQVVESFDCVEMSDGQRLNFAPE
jgi:hypothetical protein